MEVDHSAARSNSRPQGPSLDEYCLENGIHKLGYNSTRLFNRSPGQIKFTCKAPI